MKARREPVPGFLLETPRGHEYFQITFLSKRFHLLYAWSFLFPLKDKGFKKIKILRVKSEKKKLNINSLQSLFLLPFVHACIGIEYNSEARLCLTKMFKKKFFLTIVWGLVITILPARLFTWKIFLLMMMKSSLSGKKNKKINQRQRETVWFVFWE